MALVVPHIQEREHNVGVQLRNLPAATRPPPPAARGRKTPAPPAATDGSAPRPAAHSAAWCESVPAGGDTAIAPVRRGWLATEHARRGNPRATAARATTARRVGRSSAAAGRTDGSPGRLRPPTDGLSLPSAGGTTANSQTLPRPRPREPRTAHRTSAGRLVHDRAGAPAVPRSSCDTNKPSAC